MTHSICFSLGLLLLIFGNMACANFAGEMMASTLALDASRAHTLRDLPNVLPTNAQTEREFKSDLKRLKIEDKKLPAVWVKGSDFYVPIDDKNEIIVGFNRVDEQILEINGKILNIKDLPTYARIKAFLTHLSFAKIHGESKKASWEREVLFGSTAFAESPQNGAFAAYLIRASLTEWMADETSPLRRGGKSTEMLSALYDGQRKLIDDLQANSARPHANNFQTFRFSCGNNTLNKINEVSYSNNGGKVIATTKASVERSGNNYVYKPGGDSATTCQYDAGTGKSNSTSAGGCPQTLGQTAPFFGFIDIANECCQETDCSTRVNQEISPTAKTLNDLGVH